MAHHKPDTPNPTDEVSGSATDSSYPHFANDWHEQNNACSTLTPMQITNCLDEVVPQWSLFYLLVCIFG